METVMEAAKQPWMKELACAITVCDSEGIILEMNDEACNSFEKYGGKKLIGTNLFACHSQKSSEKLRDMMVHRSTNCYTVEKNRKKKMIYQTPWYKEDQYQGFVEISFIIPNEMPNFIR